MATKAKKKDIKVDANNDKEVFSFSMYPRPKQQLAMAVIDGREKTEFKRDNKLVPFRENEIFEFSLDALTKVTAQTKKFIRALAKPIREGKIVLTLGDRYGCQVLFRDQNKKSIIFSQDVLGLQNNQYFTFLKARQDCKLDFLKTYKTYTASSHVSWFDADIQTMSEYILNKIYG